MKDFKAPFSFSHFILFVISFLFLAACSHSVKEVNDNYVSGKVILKAERDSPVGWIKLDDIKTGSMESPSKMILYKFDDGKNVLDLHDSVFFKIYELDCFQYAEDIHRREDTILTTIRSKNELFQLYKAIHINLHNADSHREGPKHKKVHIEPPSFPQTPSDLYVKIYYVDAETLDPTTRDSIYISASNLPIDTTINYWIQFKESVNINGNIEDVYELTLEHIH